MRNKWDLTFLGLSNKLIMLNKPLQIDKIVIPMYLFNCEPIELHVWTMEHNLTWNWIMITSSNKQGAFLLSLINWLLFSVCKPFFWADVAEFLFGPTLDGPCI